MGDNEHCAFGSWLIASSELVGMVPCPMMGDKQKRRATRWEGSMRNSLPHPSHRFHDRIDAGRQLATALVPILEPYDHSRVVVAGLARGGVVVAAEIARDLDLALEAIVVRKVGSPWQPELAIGAVGPGDAQIHSHGLIRELGLDERSVANLTQQAADARVQLEQVLRNGLPAPDFTDRIVVLVDDGLATGASMRAALRFVRQTAATVLIAVPIASPDVIDTFRNLGVETVALITSASLGAVGAWYENFDEVRSEQVVKILQG
jgi:predicted phosphoribosyltransferase